MSLKKQTLIILPGWGGSHETWQPFIEAAGEHFTVHCIDLPCFGGVPCPTEAWGVAQYAAYAKTKISELRLPEKPILLGHSFGGQVSVEVASLNPALFSALILSAPAVVRPYRPIRRAFFYMVAKCGKLIFRLPVIEKGTLWAKKVLYRSAGSPDYSKTSAIQREIFKKIIRQDRQERLPQISIPTLILWGTRDAYLPVKDAYTIAKAIPQSTVHIVKGGTHGLHIKNIPEILREIQIFSHHLATTRDINI